MADAIRQVRNWGARRGWIALLLVALGIYSQPARGLQAIRGDSSLEWSIEQADLIVRGTVLPETPNGNGKKWQEVTLYGVETIKGERLEKVTFRMNTVASGRPFYNGSNPGKPPDPWSDILVFLQRQAVDVRANAPSSGLGYWNALSGCIFVLGPEMSPVYRMDGTVVNDGDALLAATREAATFAAKRAQTSPVYYLNMTDRTLIVPKDGRLEALGRRWIKDERVARRVMGVGVLSDFPSQENTALLGNLMTDPAYVVKLEKEWSLALEWRASKQYLVRMAVGQSIPINRQQHAIEPHLLYQPVAWRKWGAALAVIMGLALFWPRRWGKLGIGGRLALVSAGIAAMAGVLWCQTQWSCKSYSFAAGGADYEVVSYGGGVGLLRVQDDAPPHGWMVRRFEPEISPAPLWFASMLTPTDTVQIKGFSCAEGKTADAGSFSYRLLTMNYLWVVGALVAWPLVWRVGRLRLARRRRKWLKSNRCGYCGYDLRGHTGEGRCPECGEQNEVR